MEGCEQGHNGLGKLQPPRGRSVATQLPTPHSPPHTTRTLEGKSYFPRLILYASMIVPYFTSMFGTSQSGSFPSRR